MTDYRDDLEIDIKAFWEYVKRYGKWIVLAAIIGVILGGTYSYKAAINANYQDTIATDPDVLRSKLSAREIAEVDLAYKAFLQCEDIYNQINEQEITNDISTELGLVNSTQQLISINYFLKEDQKAYYSALFDADRDDQSLSNTSFDELTSIKFERRALIKYTMIGGFVGLLCSAFLLAIKYVFSPVLKTENDLRKAFMMPIIGTIDSSSAKDLPLISSYIVACAHKLEIHRLLLTSTIEDTFSADVFSNIQDELVKKDISAVLAGTVLSNSDFVENSIESDGVIIFERIGKSKYEDIAREIELCRNSNVNILGVVVIK